MKAVLLPTPGVSVTMKPRTPEAQAPKEGEALLFSAIRMEGSLQQKAVTLGTMERQLAHKLHAPLPK